MNAPLPPEPRKARRPAMSVASSPNAIAGGWTSARGKLRESGLDEARQIGLRAPFHWTIATISPRLVVTVERTPSARGMRSSASSASSGGCLVHTSATRGLVEIEPESIESGRSGFGHAATGQQEIDQLSSEPAFCSPWPSFPRECQSQERAPSARSRFFALSRVPRRARGKEECIRAGLQSPTGNTDSPPRSLEMPIVGRRGRAKRCHLVFRGRHGAPDALSGPARRRSSRRDI